MVKIFSFSACPYCTELKALLKGANIEFQDVDITLKENEAEFNEVVKITKCSDLPILQVNNQLLIPDTSFRSLNEALSVTKKILGD